MKQLSFLDYLLNEEFRLTEAVSRFDQQHNKPKHDEALNEWAETSAKISDWQQALFPKQEKRHV